MMRFDSVFRPRERNWVSFHTRPLFAAGTRYALDRSRTPDLLAVTANFPWLWRGSGSQDDTKQQAPAVVASLPFLLTQWNASFAVKGHPPRRKETGRSERSTYL